MPVSEFREENSMEALKPLQAIYVYETISKFCVCGPQQKSF